MRQTPKNIIEIASHFPQDFQWNYQHLVEAFPSDLLLKLEIWEGQLFIMDKPFSHYLNLNNMASPTKTHQKILGKLFFQIFSHIEENEDETGEVYNSPIDVKLSENTVIQPDLVYVKNPQNEEIITNADLVVEVWSQGNTKKEKECKKSWYEKAGISEFWQIEPKTQNVQVETLENQTYKTHSQAQEKGKVQSKVIQNFKVKIESLFST